MKEYGLLNRFQRGDLACLSFALLQSDEYWTMKPCFDRHAFQDFEFSLATLTIEDQQQQQLFFWFQLFVSLFRGFQTTQENKQLNEIQAP